MSLVTVDQEKNINTVVELYKNETSSINIKMTVPAK